MDDSRGGPRGATSTAQDLGSISVLLVEDDPAVRGVVERVLTRLGHRVRGVASPAETESAAGFDLAIVDLNLGGASQDGLRLLQSLEAAHPQASFVLTSGARPHLAAPEEGGPFFLQKPFSRSELVAVIERARARP